MKLPFSLLKKFIQIDESPEQIADHLTMLGLEVEAILGATSSFSDVVVAEIIQVQKHPSADNLHLLEVSDGTQTLQIVCGDTSTKKGEKVALAKIGAVLEKTIHIKKVKLRGCDSFGMLCSLKELGLTEEADSVLRLDDSFELGEDLSEKLIDPIFEISLTPNLGHCQSALGVARELSALLKRPLKLEEFSNKATKSNDFSVTIQAKDACSRYAYKIFEKVQVKPSPFWLKKTLECAGIRSINNIVDVTNYIMLLLGQPMHAFDLDRLEGKKLEIKLSQDIQKFFCLDQKEREIPPNTLLICDEKKAVALAGIMGGENSAVSLNTKRILLESAYFDPIIIRKASQRISLRSESSIRFEKGIDPNFSLYALEFAAKILHEICAAQSKKASVDIKTKDFCANKINIRLSRTCSIIGLKISLSEMESLFKRLFFSTKILKEDVLQVSVPTFRNDITQEIDLIEEVARLYGLNNIPKTPPLFASSTHAHHPMYLFENEVRNRCISLGLTEMMSSDLIHPSLAQITQEMSLLKKDMISVLHSKSEDHSVLRASLMPSFLQNLGYNAAHKNFDISAFEIGRIHFLRKGECIEQTVLGVLLTGKEKPFHWEQKENSFDFFDLKGKLENLFQALLLPCSFQNSVHPSFHPSKQANIFVEKVDIGALGEVHPILLEKFGLKQSIFFAEINLNSLLRLQKDEILMNPLPQYPSSERDVTFTLQKTLSYDYIQSILQKISVPLLQNVFLINIFESEKLGQNQKT